MPPPPAAPALSGGIAARPWWPWAKRLGTLLFFGLVAWLLVRQAGTIDWDEVLQALLAMPRSVLAGAAGLALLTYAVYSTFDLVGRYCIRHGLPVRRVVGVTLISYAFNLNLGSLVGGVAFRYRLYARLGLRPEQTTKVLALSMLTNWIGYCLLAGIVFWTWPPALPPQWKIDSSGLRWLGAGLVAVALAYLLACVVRRGRELVVRGRRLPLPTWPVALVQLALGCAHWSLNAGILYVLLQGRLDYPAVLATLLVGAVAGVIAHVPAGLGVLETVFVALLSHQAPAGVLLAALFGYRVVYYLVPLAVATVAYFATELRSRRRRSVAAGRPPR